MKSEEDVRSVSSQVPLMHFKSKSTRSFGVLLPLSILLSVVAICMVTFAVIQFREIPGRVSRQNEKLSALTETMIDMMEAIREAKMTIQQLKIDQGTGDDYDDVMATSPLRSSQDNFSTCKLSPDPGPCKAFMTRYFFDPALGECVNFVYGGCGGNDNNFQTVEECTESCRVGGVDNKKLPTNEEQYENEPCHLNPDEGFCTEDIHRFYFDHQENKCKTFIYGGCGGNANNFVTLQECVERCHPESMDPCTMPSDVGPCRALVERWFFDAEGGGVCRKFNWGGCGGNPNNYASEEKCISRCMPN